MTENSNGLVMPVAPAYGGSGFGGGLGYGGDFWLILILLFCFGGWGGGFGGGWGANNIAADSAVMYPWMNQAQITTNGFQTQALNSSIAGLQNSITAGFGDVQLGIAGINQGICQSTAGITQAVANGFSQAEIANNSRQIANMQQGFAQQTAMNQGFNGIQNSMNQGFNGIQSQLANCCCENRAGIADLKYTVATENCADRQTSTQNTQAILTALNSGVQSIKDQLCSDKIEQKNDTIAQLRSELMYARGQASQDVQTAVIQAGQRGLANEVEQYVAPRAIPAYVVQNPSCCNQAVYGCGCGM